MFKIVKYLYSKTECLPWFYVELNCKFVALIWSKLYRINLFKKVLWRELTYVCMSIVPSNWRTTVMSSKYIDIGFLIRPESWTVLRGKYDDFLIVHKRVILLDNSSRALAVPRSSNPRSNPFIVTHFCWYTKLYVPPKMAKFAKSLYIGCANFPNVTMLISLGRCVLHVVYDNRRLQLPGATDDTRYKLVLVLKIKKNRILYI